MKKSISIAAFIALSTLATAALSSAQAAEVRVANLASNAHKVDLWVGDKQVASSVGSDAASSFVDVGSGLQKVMVTEAGTVYPIGVVDLNLDSSSQYTLVLVGDILLQTRLTPFQTQKVTPQSGQVALRVFNLANTQPSLEVSQVGNLTEGSAMAMAVTASSSTLDVSFAGSSVDLTSTTPTLSTNTDVFVIDEGYIGNSPNLQTVTITE